MAFENLVQLSFTEEELTKRRFISRNRKNPERKDSSTHAPRKTPVRQHRRAE